MNSEKIAFYEALADNKSVVEILAMKH
ncbi:hypothetical protein [Methanosarcina barkeri]